MATFIVMTAEQADSVRTEILQPVERQGGVFIVGIAVLADRDHEEQWPLLATFPTVDSDSPDFPGELDPPEL